MKRYVFGYLAIIAVFLITIALIISSCSNKDKDIEPIEASSMEHYEDDYETTDDEKFGYEDSSSTEHNEPSDIVYTLRKKPPQPSPKKIQRFKLTPITISLSMKTFRIIFLNFVTPTT